MRNSTIPPSKIDRDENLQQALTEKLAELNELLGDRNKEIFEKDLIIHSQAKKISELAERTHSSDKFLSALDNYISIKTLNKMAEQLKLDDPTILLAPKYIPSRVKKILDIDFSTNKIVALAERSDLFSKHFLAMRNRRVVKGTRKHQTTVFFSILGIIELSYWYTWEEKRHLIFNEIMLESKAIFKYLENR